MKFDKRAYYIPNHSKNKTNSKSYDNLNNNFSIYADFKLNKFTGDESLIVGRKGFHMGIFVQKPNLVKFTWYTKPNVYNNICFGVENIYMPMKIFVSVSDTIKMHINDDYFEEKDRGDIVDYNESIIVIGSINPFGEHFPCWFNGDINRISIYDDSISHYDFKYDDNSKNIYADFDFIKNSKFKTFDVSNNGNHAIIFEEPEYYAESINKFNEIAPKQKLI